uniref:Uncharacterized protein n=1 Tax=Cucumis melo TaxID=3656 RepID=A0A9I9CY89_CUCME
MSGKQAHIEAFMKYQATVAKTSPSNEEAKETPSNGLVWSREGKKGHSRWWSSME